MAGVTTVVDFSIVCFAAAGTQVFRNAFIELKTCSNYCDRAVANRAAALSDVWVFTVARIRVCIIRNLWISMKIYVFCGYESVTIFRQQTMDNMWEHILMCNTVLGCQSLLTHCVSRL